jgi:multidrug resistance efflux pump
MLFGFVLLFGYALVVWLVFFKFKWMKFNIAWGIVSVSVGLHLLLIFMIGLRFVAPYSTDAKIIQHTIQLIPRLPEPTLVTAVLVEPNVPVKKGQPLFQFDRRPYQYKVNQLEAELAKQGAGPEEDAQKWAARVAAYSASIKEAQAEEKRARLRYASQINGVNTTVAQVQAELDQARYYLDNTLMVAPEDGYIINLQVRAGMVAGIVRLGAIASFIVDADRYLLATFFQENLKYVKPGQPVEAALDLYPGQIFTGKVEAIWQGSGAGQLLPSGKLPRFFYVPTELPQGQFAVAIRLDDKDQSKFPIGTQGRATIYTNADSGFAVLRRIGIRAYTWSNWLYPFSG